MKNLIIPLVLVLSVLSIFSISATTTLVVPADSASGCLNLVVNVTTAAHGGVSWNCTIYAKSTLTANSSWETIKYQMVNTSAGEAYSKLNLSSVEDANNYILNATCRNITGVLETGDTSTGVTVDCTAPTAPTLSPATDTVKTTSGSQTFTGTVVDGTTTSCTYIIGLGGFDTSVGTTTSAAGTYSGTTCTFSKTFSNQNDNGNWYWRMTASDETNTSSTSGILQVQIAPTGGYDESEDVVTQTTWLQNITKNTDFWIVIGFVVGIVVLYFILKR